MNIEALIVSAIEFLSSEPIIAIGIMIILGLLLYFKTGPTLKAIVLVFILVGLVYIGSFILGATSTGFTQKEKMVQQE